MYLKVQGFGRGGVQYGQGKEPHGWPTESYSWNSFKGTARGCSMQMAEEIISAMLSAQDTKPEDLIDDGSGTDSDEDDVEILMTQRNARPHQTSRKRPKKVTF